MNHYTPNYLKIALKALKIIGFLGFFVFSSANSQEIVDTSFSLSLVSTEAVKPGETVVIDFFYKKS